MKPGRSFPIGKMFEAYQRIFERCGLRFKAVEADSGAIGGSFSHEFMVLAETGEDAVMACGACRYAANVERAVSGWQPREEPQDPGPSPAESGTPRGRERWRK